MTVLLNKTLASAASALVLLVLAGCKPGPDPLADSERTDSSRRSGAAAAARDPVAARPAGDAPDSRTASMGAAPARSLPPGIPGALPPPAGGREPDPEITAGVKARLAADAELREVRIDVDTRDGVVTLSGSVPTAAVRARAGELAHAVRGVRRVNDQLTLASG